VPRIRGFPVEKRRQPPSWDLPFAVSPIRKWTGLTWGTANKKGVIMFLILFIVLLVVWLLGWAAFHVAGGLIHLLLIIAVIFLILHFVRGRRVS